MLKFGNKPVYLACEYTDMRKQIDRLAAKVQADFSLNPFDGALFVFCNRARNRSRCLNGTVTAFGCTSSAWNAVGSVGLSRAAGHLCN